MWRDQGFSSSFWLGLLFAFTLRFVLRWKKEYQLVDAEAQPAGGLEDRARQAGMGRIMFAYARRWQIELTWRENKSELAFQSPRLWHWEPREKLLLLATLAYAFLLTLLAPFYEPLRRWRLASVLPSHRSALPPGPRSLCSPAPGAQSVVANVSPALGTASGPLSANHFHHARLSEGLAPRADEALPGQSPPGQKRRCFQAVRQNQQSRQITERQEEEAHSFSL